VVAGDCHPEIHLSAARYTSARSVESLFALWPRKRQGTRQTAAPLLCAFAGAGKKKNSQHSKQPGRAAQQAQPS